MSNTEKTVLIVGASGLVGSAATHAFLDAGWEVIAASRKPPLLLEGRAFQYLSLDLQDATACQKAVSSLRHVTHVVYTAVYELPGLVAGWSDPEQIATNGRMLRNILDPLVDAAPIEHITILQGTKAYGASVKPMRVPARESQPRVPHPNFYWLHEDHVKQLQANLGIAYTILRPQLIVGPNHGVVMNLPPVIGAYAAIRAHEGLPFSFPGGPDWPWEAVDARLVGRACVWAATNKAAANETFNLTNGEVFMWRDMWPAIADTLGVEPGPPDSHSVAAYLNERAHIWDQVVATHKLQPNSLQTIVGESHYYADLCFAYGMQSAPPPTFVSTIKIKQAGFADTWDSEQSFCYWLRDLQQRMIIPPPKAE